MATHLDVSLLPGTLTTLAGRFRRKSRLGYFSSFIVQEYSTVIDRYKITALNSKFYTVCFVTGEMSFSFLANVLEWLCNSVFVRYVLISAVIGRL